MKATARFCGNCDYEKPVEPIVVTEPIVVEKDDLAAAVRKVVDEYKPPEVQPAGDIQEVTELKKEIINIIPSKEEFNDFSKKMESGAKREIADYKKASSETRAGVPVNTPKTSHNVLIAVIAGIIVISAGIGGFFYFSGHQQATPPQPPVLAAPVPVTTTTPEVKPAEPETPKAEVAQETPKQPELPKLEDKPKVEPKKAQKPNVATRKPTAEKKPEVIKETMPAKVEPVKTVEPAAEAKDVGHVAGEVQSWLSSNGFNVVAAAKDNKIVVKGSGAGSVKPAEHAKIMTKVKSYGVPVRDLIVVNTN